MNAHTIYALEVREEENFQNKFDLLPIDTHIATGRMFKIPMIVRHFPLTSSTHSTKDTTTTAIDAKPMITLPAM